MKLRVTVSMLPLGAFVVALASTPRTSSSERPSEATLAGSIWTRTAGFCSPPMLTWPTPGIWLIRCASMVSA